MKIGSAVPKQDIEAGPSAKILVVDDEPAISVAFAKKLRREGYDCVTAASGEEALRRMQEYGPDLVISDVRMPGMTGIELLKKLKRAYPTTRVILTSAYAEIDFVIEALRHGADDYLLKPFNLTELSSSVSRTLEEVQESARANCEVGAGTSSALVVDENGASAASWGILALAAAIETREQFAQGHVERVAGYARAVGSELGLNAHDLHALWLSAVLHDAGKLVVPEVILNKPGPLDEEEMLRVREYALVGARFVEGVPGLEEAADGILHHREKWDGSGYPTGLEGEAISMAGRIINVVEAFDAMVHDRPYREALTHEEALRELRAADGTAFDPRVLAAFLRTYAGKTTEGPVPVG